MRCWVEIDTKQLQQNVRKLRILLQPKKIIAVVKADAYRHGAIEVAHLLQQEGICDFAIATLEEAVCLRQAGITGNLLVLGYTPAQDADTLHKHCITQTIVSQTHAQQLCKVGAPIQAQLAIDTGMHRIGVPILPIEQCEQIVRECHRRLQLQGVFSHLAAADEFEKEVFTKQQITEFSCLLSRISDLRLPYTHIENSAGGLWHSCDEDTPFSHVRLGIALYGYSPNPNRPLPSGVAPCLRWYTKVIHLQTVEAGQSVSYGCSFVAPSPMRIATLSVGYADGYDRALSGRGSVKIHGKQAPIVGRICMDQMMVDVTGIPQVQVGDTATLLDETHNAQDLATELNTISYEVLCRISARVQRRYIS